MFFTKSHAYMIDSENVGSTWAELLKNEEKCDFYIFVTENAKSLNFSLLKDLTENQKHRINIIECEPGKNSLDFYLSSYLGYLIGTGKHNAYTVVSQDTGFDHVIEYWKKQGLEVERINTKPDKPNTRSNRQRSQTQTVKKNENSETRIIPKKEPSEPAKQENKPSRSKRNRNSNASANANKKENPNKQENVKKQEPAVQENAKEKAPAPANRNRSYRNKKNKE